MPAIFTWTVNAWTGYSIIYFCLLLYFLQKWVINQLSLWCTFHACFPLPSLYRMPPWHLRWNLPTPEVEEKPHPVKRGRRAKNQAPHIATSQSTEREVTPLQEIIAQLPASISHAFKEGIEAASAVGLAEAIQPDQSDSAALLSNTANATPSSSISGAINSVVKGTTRRLAHLKIYICISPSP